MKALLICPEQRPAVSHLAEICPLVLAPMMGKTLLDYWLDHLAGQRVTHVHVLASERPEQVRAWVGEGARWSMKVEVAAEPRELAPAEARAKYRGNDNLGWLPEPDDVSVIDFLPGQPDWPRFTSYVDWFVAAKHWLPRAAAAPDRIGLREVKPGVWIGLRSRVAGDAELLAPCWIGENALVGERAKIGPGAIVENGAVIAGNTDIADSLVGPETFIGEWTELKNSIAWGSTLINWRTDSCTRVPDAFLMCALSQRPAAVRTARWPGRLLAILVMLLTLPVGLYGVLKAWPRGERVLQPLIAVRPHRANGSPASETLIYHEFSAVNGLLRRWPQLWKVVCGDFAWVGNRPLSPAAAAMLSNEFERLWLKTPIGLFSLADAEACVEPFNEEARVHASYYAVQSDWRMDLSILSRIFRRRYQ